MRLRDVLVGCGVALASWLLAGCAGADSGSASPVAPAAPGGAQVAGVQETRPPVTLAAGGSFEPGDESCIRGRLQVTLTTPPSPDGSVPRLQTLPVTERQKVADAYLDCEADAGLRSLVAAGLQVGNPAITAESAVCQSQALYDGLGRARFAALATAAIRLDDLSDNEVLAYQGKVQSCP